MDLIKEIHAHDFEIGYDINIYRDTDNDRYVAQLNMFSHPIMPTVKEGEPIPLIEDLGRDELHSQDLENLVEECRNKVSKSGTKRIIFEVRDVDS